MDPLLKEEVCSVAQPALISDSRPRRNQTCSPRVCLRILPPRVCTYRPANRQARKPEQVLSPASPASVGRTSRGRGQSKLPQYGTVSTPELQQGSSRIRRNPKQTTWVQFPDNLKKFGKLVYSPRAQSKERRFESRPCQGFFLSTCPYRIGGGHRMIQLLA